MLDVSARWSRQKLAILEHAENRVQRLLIPIGEAFAASSVIYIVGVAWLSLSDVDPKFASLTEVVSILITGASGIAITGLFSAIALGCIVLKALRGLTEGTSRIGREDVGRDGERTRLDKRACK